MVRAARHLSDVVSPPTIFAAVGIAFGIYERPILPGLAWGVIYGVIGSLLPVLFIFYLLQSGRIGDLHMSNTGERNIPYFVGVVAAFIAFGVISLLDGPDLLRCLALYNIITLTALGLINTRWLISIHATSIAGAWLMISFVFGWGWSLVLLPLVVLVCWTRYFLKRHTVAQILAGVAVGITIVLVFRQFGCFYP
jgi:membrane-associated phospholipid phosphatase